MASFQLAQPHGEREPTIVEICTVVLQFGLDTCLGLYRSTEMFRCLTVFNIHDMMIFWILWILDIVVVLMVLSFCTIYLEWEELDFPVYSAAQQ